MIQAAHVAPALRFAPIRHAVCFLPPSLGLLRSGGVRSGRAAAWPVQWPGRKRRGSTPPAALRSARRGVPRPSAAPGRVPVTPQPPRRAASVAALWAARGGSARPLLRFASSPCGSGRFAPCGRVREGPALAGTAPLAPKSRGGRECARSPRPAWPLAPSPSSSAPLCSPSTDGGGIAPPVGLRSRHRRPLPACGAPPVRAWSRPSRRRPSRRGQAVVC